MIDIPTIGIEKYDPLTDREINLLACKLIGDVFGSHAEAGAKIDFLGGTPYFIDWPSNHPLSMGGLDKSLVRYRGAENDVWNPCDDPRQALELVQVIRTRGLDVVWGTYMARRRWNERKSRYIDIVLAGPREWTICVLLAIDEQQKVSDANR